MKFRTKWGRYELDESDMRLYLVHESVSKNGKVTASRMLFKGCSSVFDAVEYISICDKTEIDQILELSGYDRNIFV